MVAAGAIEADVCVVGGGFTGLSAGLHLAQAGFRVVLLEAQRVGFGASGRNGGQVGTGQRRDQKSLEAMVGPARAKALWDMSLDAVGLVKQLCDTMGQPFHPGIIHAAHRARFVPEFHEEVSHLAQAYGYSQMQPLDNNAIRDLVASEAYHGGFLDLGGGHIDPLRFALGLATLAETAGVVIHERSRVLTIDRGTPRCTVRTEKAQIRAEHVILACNGYLGDLAPQVSAYVMPINNFIVATEPIPDSNALIKSNHAVADSKFVVNYFRFSEDHRLLFGGSESYGYRFPTDIAAKVRRPLRQIFPQIGDIPFTHAWGGTLGITLNRMPHFAHLAPNILSLSGYSGHGVAMATMGGRIAAEAVAGQAQRFDLIARVPGSQFPGGARLRWPLLVLAMAWYSLRDKI